MASGLPPSLVRPPVDLRALLPADLPVQGHRPLCVPFAVGGAHEAARTACFSRSPLALGVEGLWSFCLAAGNAGHDGTDFPSIARAVATDGQPLSALWPYNPLLGAGTEPAPPAAGLAPWHTASIEVFSLAHDGIEDRVEDELASQHAVALMIELTPGFENPDANGTIAVPALTTPAGDYHAILVVGAATDGARSARLLLIRNTWGVLWGWGGYAWLPVDYLVNFAVVAAIIRDGTVSPEATNRP